MADPLDLDAPLAPGPDLLMPLDAPEPPATVAEGAPDLLTTAIDAIPAVVDNLSTEPADLLSTEPARVESDMTMAEAQSSLAFLDEMSAQISEEPPPPPNPFSEVSAEDGAPPMAQAAAASPEKAAPVDGAAEELGSPQGGDFWDNQGGGSDEDEETETSAFQNVFRRDKIENGLAQAKSLWGLGASWIKEKADAAKAELPVLKEKSTEK